MVIGDQYRKCVVFLFADVPDPDNRELKRTPAATAFLAGVPAPGPPPVGSEGVFFRYLVTARHVVALSRKYGSLFVRIHRADDSAVFMELPPDAWHEHPSEEVAVSLLRTSAPLNHVLIATDQFALDAKVGEYRIATGDEVFFVGLFSEHPGTDRNQPILRFGNISLMPDERYWSMWGIQPPASEPISLKRAHGEATVGPRRLSSFHRIDSVTAFQWVPPCQSSCSASYRAIRKSRARSHS